MTMPTPQAREAQRAGVRARWGRRKAVEEAHARAVAKVEMLRQRADELAERNGKRRDTLTFEEGMLAVLDVVAKALEVRT